MLVWQIVASSWFKAQLTTPKVSQGLQAWKQIQCTKEAAQPPSLHHKAHPDRYVLDMPSQHLHDLSKG
jgi:hypothetical protein